MREFLHYLHEAFWEMVQPRTHVLSDEDQQSVDEQVRVRTAYIQSHKHPPECAGGCQCGLWKQAPDGAA